MATTNCHLDHWRKNGKACSILGTWSQRIKAQEQKKSLPCWGLIIRHRELQLERSGIARPPYDFLGALVLHHHLYLLPSIAQLLRLLLLVCYFYFNSAGADTEVEGGRSTENWIFAQDPSKILCLSGTILSQFQEVDESNLLYINRSHQWKTEQIWDDKLPTA